MPVATEIFILRCGALSHGSWYKMAKSKGLNSCRLSLPMNNPQQSLLQGGHDSAGGL